MDKQDTLKVKLITLIHEIENAKNMVDAETQEFLINLESLVKKHLINVEQGTFPASHGNLLGTTRAISEFNNLLKIDALCDAAYDADVYYSNECYDWS